MNENQKPKILATLTSTVRENYWNSLANRLQNKVSAIDPDRLPLYQLRQSHPELIGCKVYRASTGGKWGKSSQIVTL